VSAEPVIAPSARKHGISDEDILHVYANAIRVFELDDGFMMLIGANPAAVLHTRSESSTRRRVRSWCTRCQPARGS